MAALKGDAEPVATDPAILSVQESSPEKPVGNERSISAEVKNLFMSLSNCPICGVDGTLMNCSHHC